MSVARASADKHGMAMPLLSHVGFAGAFWPGRCGPPLDERRPPACSGDQGEQVWQGGRGHGGEKRREGGAHGHGRHGGDFGIHGPPLGLLLSGLEVEEIRGHGGVGWGSRVRPKLFTIVFLICSIFVQFKFLQRLIEFIWLQNLKSVCLVEF